MASRTVPMMVIALVSAAVVTAGPSGGEGVRRLHYDLVTAHGEAHVGAVSPDSSLNGDADFQTWWLYATVPGVRIANRPLFLSLEADGMTRGGVGRHDAASGGRFFQRYGVFAGYPVVKLSASTGTIMVGAGLAGTFSRLMKENGYVHLIYDHRFAGTDRFSWGLGILLKYRMGRFIPMPNLLFSMDWVITPTTFLRADWDVLELRQYVARDLALVAEVRYDLNFYALDNRDAWTRETAGAGGGVDWMVTKDFVVRLRCKKLAFVREGLAYAGGGGTGGTGSAGWSVKVAAAYGR